MTKSTNAAAAAASSLRRSSRVVKKNHRQTQTTTGMTVLSAPRRIRVAATAMVAAAVSTSTTSNNSSVLAEAFNPLPSSCTTTSGKRAMSTMTTPTVVVTPEKRNARREISCRESSSSSSSSSNHKNNDSGESKDHKNNNNNNNNKSPPKAQTTCKPPKTSTTSFAALTAATWPPLANVPERETPMHTLILGTHPSEESFKQGKYYAFPLNAFWWMTGDCLGFRRDCGVSPSTGKPYKFAQALRPEYADKILSYEDQVSCLVRHGFGLWDIVGACKRTTGSSLDKDISNARANPIREFVAQHAPQLRRIVISNGDAAATMFCRHFADWCASGELQPNDDTKSQKVLQRKLQGGAEAPIKVVVATSPSPAATMAYANKRDFWEKHVFEPGLKDHLALKEEEG